MSPAAAIALVAATLNLSAAVVLLVIAGAPGWRPARTFSAIAATAGLFSAVSYVLWLDGLPTETYLRVTCALFLLWHFNSLAWMPHAFGGPDASWRGMPGPLRLYSVLSAAAALLLVATGPHLNPEVLTVEVGWAGVHHHYATPTALGTLYGVAILAQFALVLFQFLRRAVRGERAELAQVVGIAILIVAGSVEILAANPHAAALPLRDIGMVCAVLPVAIKVMRRFVVDAQRLSTLSGQLAGEVLEQAEWRDRAQTALVESERMAAIGRMAAGIGHEINNPLSYVMLSLDEVELHLRASGAPAPVIAALGYAQEGSTRIQKVAERLRRAARRPTDGLPLDLHDVVVEAAKIAGSTVRLPARLEVDLQACPRIVGDHPRLVQAVVDLVTNAALAVAERSGARLVRVATGTGPRGEALVSVRDDGIGIPPESLTRLGEPYFTTRADAGALGLGLFVTRGTVDGHGGTLTFERAPDHGTVVTLSFPGLPEPLVPVVAPPPAAAEPVANDSLAASVGTPDPAGSEPAVDTPGAPSPLPAHAAVVQPFRPRTAATVPAPAAADAPRPAGVVEPAKPTVLLIDDEPLVAKLLATALGKRWAVTVASSGPDALDAMARQAFDAVICDLMMPGMSGMALADEVARRDPALRARMLFLTGGAVTTEADVFLARPDVQYLIKPVELRQLLAALDAVASVHA